MFVTPSEFTVPVTGDLAVHEVLDATVTVFGSGRLRVVSGQPSHYVTGAVYNRRGTLVRASQRIGGLHNDHAVAADPDELPGWSGPTRQLTGTWLFGGTWFNHFGHFLTETMTTLWAEDETDGLLFVPFWFGGDILPWQAELLTLAGVQQQVHVVGAERVRVERLLIPDRPVIPNGQIRPEAYQVWRRMAAAARRPDAPERVFLSRSHFHSTVDSQSAAARRIADNEVELDELMTELGYTVVHPEALSATEQVAAVAGARVLAGVSGSALHLSVFAPEGATVVELGDVRGWTRPVRTQQMICRAGSNPMAFIRFPPEGRSYDLVRIADLLRVNGLVGS